jgi:DNA-binding NarL/FixJ family response regulator
MTCQRVVLAEDHAEVARQLCTLLANDYEVLDIVPDGRALVVKVAELKPDVVVSDVTMPGMNGLSAARAILDRNPEARIVFVTVQSEPDVVRRALALGVLGYVLKCDAGEELLAAVRSSLEGRQYLSAGARRQSWRRDHPNRG